MDTTTKNEGTECIIDTTRLSEGVGEGIMHLASILRVQPWSLFVAFLNFIGMAAGNTFKIRTPIFPYALNLALDLIVCDDDQSRLSQVIDFLAQPLRDFQDGFLAGIDACGRTLMEKELAKLEAAHATAYALGEPLPDDLLPRIAKLRPSVRPFVLVEDPQNGHLTQASRKSCDDALGVIYHADAFGRLLDAAETGAANDLVLLRNGLVSRSDHAACFESKPGSAILRPAVSAFIIAPSAQFGRCFESENPVISQWSAQVIYISAVDPNSTVHIDPALATECWGHLFKPIRALLKSRQANREFSLELSPQAAKIFVEFWHQQITHGRSLPKPANRFAENAPVVAAKLAGNTHLLSPDRMQPIPGAVMEKAVATAERLSTDTAKLADILGRQRRDALLSETAEKMFDFLAQMGKTKRWPLWMRFDKHPKDLMERALDLLIRSGRAHPYPDGCVEAIDPLQPGKPVLRS
jgi:hypothetical protein